MRPIGEMAKCKGQYHSSASKRFFSALFTSSLEAAKTFRRNHKIVNVSSQKFRCLISTQVLATRQ